MVPFAIAGILDLAAAVVLVGAVLRRLREQRAPALFPYLFYLVFWYALVLYMLVYLISPRILPEGARRGYMLYNSIFIIPLHGLIAYFFADFIWKLLGKAMPRLLKMAIFGCFAAILVVYAREIFIRLSTESENIIFVLEAPVSGYLLFVCIIGLLVYARIAGHGLENRERGKLVLIYALITGGGFMIGFLSLIGAFSLPGMYWSNAVTSVAMAAVNIPGWLYLRRFYDRQARAAAAELSGVDLSPLEKRYGITPREREIISLVITGRSNREITDELFISPDTVKKHIYNAYRKIGVKNRVQLVNAVLELSGDRP